MAINNVSLGEVFVLNSLGGEVSERVQRFEKYDLIKNVVLLTPGMWNEKNYTSEELMKAFHNTDWSDPNILSIIADHNDDDENHVAESIHDWLGYVENPRMIGTNLLGDVRLYDPEQRSKVVDAKAKFGISAKLQGANIEGVVRDFTFKNFSVVTTPACKNAYFNLSQEKQNEKQIEYDKIFSTNKLSEKGKVEKDLIELEGGNINIKMTGEDLKDTPKAIQEEVVKVPEIVEEVKEEIKEEVKPEVKEEVVAEVTPEVVPEVVKEIEAPKEEIKEEVPEVKEELSSEKLSELKLSDALSRIEKLEMKFSDFEKLSAKSVVVKEEISKDKVTETLSNKDSWAGFNGHAGISQGSYELANLIIGKYSK